ncbi:hypothetical protein G3O08_13020 [Cryomorpha ignava]|uniref:T9SS type A sorting domain-containing protein n=1 Tax=Cryomorpha ignava TaxID=101383 RepID=A0A7K3WSJ3_9FLAO|nr:hypothetical protein [Cryomorpha ignava]NEN24426.1 hypothetical protein [Cryomorpha ignava]
MVNIKYFLLVSSIVLFLFVFYRWLTRYLRKNDINIPFAYLFPFENEKLKGIETLKFDLPLEALVRAEVVRENGELVTVIFEEQFKTGIHTKEINLSSVANGTYNLRFCVPDQTITRFIVIANGVA